jgi:hypothetical protein
MANSAWGLPLGSSLLIAKLASNNNRGVASQVATNSTITAALNNISIDNAPAKAPGNSILRDFAPRFAGADALDAAGFNSLIDEFYAALASAFPASCGADGELIYEGSSGDAFRALFSFRERVASHDVSERWTLEVVRNIQNRDTFEVSVHRKRDVGAGAMARVGFWRIDVPWRTLANTAHIARGLARSITGSLRYAPVSEKAAPLSIDLSI